MKCAEPGVVARVWKRTEQRRLEFQAGEVDDFPKEQEQHDAAFAGLDGLPPMRQTFCLWIGKQHLSLRSLIVMLE